MQGTLFELDLDPSGNGGAGITDMLTFGSTGNNSGKKAYIRIATIGGGVATEGSVVTILRPGDQITEIEILGESREQVINPDTNNPETVRRVTLNSQAWTIGFNQAPQATGRVLTLTAGAAPVVNLASWTDVVSAASSVLGQFSGAATSQDAPGVSQEAEVSQDGGLASSPILWTSLRTGSEEQTLSNTRKEKYDCSFQLFSGGIVLVGDGAETRVSHSISLTYGTIDSGKDVSTSVTGFGYGAHFAMAEGAYFALSGTMVNSSSEKTAGGVTGEFDVGGQVLSAEGGKTSQVRDGLDMTLMGGLTVGSAGDVKLKSGDSLSGYSRTTASFGARLDREQAADEASRSSSSLFGTAMVAHDLSSGFDFQQSGEASVSIDAAKTWLNLSGGMAWRSESGRFYFEGSLEQSVAGASASRQSVTVGYDLKW